VFTLPPPNELVTGRGKRLVGEDGGFGTSEVQELMLDVAAVVGQCPPRAVYVFDHLSVGSVWFPKFHFTTGAAERHQMNEGERRDFGLTDSQTPTLLTFRA
jgi:hypothetical protein